MKNTGSSVSKPQAGLKVIELSTSIEWRITRVAHGWVEMDNGRIKRGVSVADIKNITKWRQKDWK